MKYIRVIDDLGNEYLTTYKEHCEMVAELQDSGFDFEGGIIKQADTIPELCDEFVVVQKDFHDLLNADTHCLQTLKKYYEINKIEVLGIYGAIWTEWGLKYVAKMNDKGELELL